MGMDWTHECDIRESGADEAIIPEYEGSLMTGRMTQKYYPAQSGLK
jgi:hypothetical protein